MARYGLIAWNRALQQQQFFRTWFFFFRACLDCFQSPQNQHADRVGSLKHCFAPPNLLLRASSSRPSSPKTNALTIVLQDPCLWRISPSYSLSLSLSLSDSLSLSWLGCKGLGGLAWVAVAEKQRDLKKCFFGTALVNLTSNFSGSETLFFHIPPERWNGMNPSRRDLKIRI